MNEILIVLLGLFKILKFFGLGILYSFLAFMLIQLISYRIFNKNIYKWLCYNLIYKYM